MFGHLETILLSYINTLPLEIFAFVASFIEEVIAPIPSPTVMIVTGAAASLKGYPIISLALLALIGATGKTVGALIVYGITDRAENFIMQRLGRYFDITHEDVERLGQKLGKGARDYIALTVLRALPFMPSSVVSVGCGLLKVPLRLYIPATFIGTIVRDSVYLYFGYAGIRVLGSIINQSQSLEAVLEALALLAGATILGYLFFKRRVRARTQDF